MQTELNYVKGLRSLSFFLLACYIDEAKVIKLGAICMYVHTSFYGASVAKTTNGLFMKRMV